MDPKELAALSPEEIDEKIESALSELKSLVEAEDPSDEDVTKAKEIASTVDALTAERDERTAKAEAKQAEVQALRDRFLEDQAEAEEGPEDEEDDGEEEVEEVDAPEEPQSEADEPAEAKEPVPASTKKVAQLAKRVKRPAAPKRAAGGVRITASNDVPGYSTGQALETLTDVAQAVINRSKGFSPPQGDGKTVNIQQFGTASITLDFPEELTVDRMDDADEAIDFAVKESRLPGGSLTASGGWCAPSEVVYDLDMDATTEGMLSLPEIAVRRGGIRFAGSPNFADYYANPGFVQTEAQAIAGTAKPCIEVNCPTFTDVRLDAEGVCIKVPILTNAGYPEYVRTFVQGTLVAHQHWMNANVIGRLVTAAGAARVFTGKGTTHGDTLEALELVINQTRQKYRLSFRQSMEVVLPFWVKGAIRADLAKRTGQVQIVTDQQINSHFAAHGANVQFVYDWQTISESALTYPSTFQALVYPAGTFVKGVAPVINLNTIYDAASLQQNLYTGLFTEQGVLVAKKKFHADLLTLSICNSGRTGAANFTTC